MIPNSDLMTMREEAEQNVTSRIEVPKDFQVKID